MNELCLPSIRLYLIAILLSNIMLFFNPFALPHTCSPLRSNVDCLSMIWAPWFNELLFALILLCWVIGDGVRFHGEHHKALALLNWRVSTLYIVTHYLCTVTVHLKWQNEYIFFYDSSRLDQSFNTYETVDVCCLWDYHMGVSYHRHFSNCIELTLLTMTDIMSYGVAAEPEVAMETRPSCINSL